MSRTFPVTLLLLLLSAIGGQSSGIGSGAEIGQKRTGIGAGAQIGSQGIGTGAQLSDRNPGIGSGAQIGGHESSGIGSGAQIEGHSHGIGSGPQDPNRKTGIGSGVQVEHNTGIGSGAQVDDDDALDDVFDTPDQPVNIGSGAEINRLECYSCSGTRECRNPSVQVCSAASMSCYSGAVNAYEQTSHMGCATGCDNVKTSFLGMSGTRNFDRCETCSTNLCNRHILPEPKQRRRSFLLTCNSCFTSFGCRSPSTTICSDDEDCYVAANDFDKTPASMGCTKSCDEGSTAIYDRCATCNTDKCNTKQMLPKRKDGYIYCHTCSNKKACSENDKSQMCSSWEGTSCYGVIRAKDREPVKKGCATNCRTVARQMKYKGNETLLCSLCDTDNCNSDFSLETGIDQRTELLPHYKSSATVKSSLVLTLCAMLFALLK